MAVIETTTLRLAHGVDDATFLAADEKVRTGFLYRQPGLMRATTARGDDGEWIVAVLWASDDDADAAAARAETDPAYAALTALIDGATLHRRRYTTFD
jgi:hypothetical protein